jgi:hypothetical protein
MYPTILLAAALQDWERYSRAYRGFGHASRAGRSRAGLAGEGPASSPALGVRSDEPEPMPCTRRKPSAGGRGLRGGQGQETARLQEVCERDEQGLIGLEDFPHEHHTQ